MLAGLAPSRITAAEMLFFCLVASILRPPWVPGLLTCSLVGFAHGKNDRQKCIGPVMPAVIGAKADRRRVLQKSATRQFTAAWIATPPTTIVRSPESSRLPPKQVSPMRNMVQCGTCYSPALD
jgi:hypothetical protein